MGATIVVDSENRKEKSRKLSVFSTIKIEGHIPQEIVLLARTTVAVKRIDLPNKRQLPHTDYLSNYLPRRNCAGTGTSRSGTSSGMDDSNLSVNP